MMLDGIKFDAQQRWAIPDGPGSDLDSDFTLAF